MIMELIDKNSYYFPVTDVIEEGRNKYYIVDVNGTAYKIKMFDFQHALPRPETVLCMARRQESGNGFYFVQDYSPFISQFYQVGLEYPFKVVSANLSQAFPYYQIRDNHGFFFRLVHSGSPYLEPHDNITCRVEKIAGYKVKLRFVPQSARRHLKFFTVKQLSAAINHESLGRLVERYLMFSPEWATVAEEYANKQGIWILRALAHIHATLDVATHPHKTLPNVLEGMVDVSLYLLEGCAFMRDVSDDERAKYQKVLEGYVNYYQTLLEAQKMVKAKRDEEFVENLLDKMRNSGYLYNPERNLALLMTIFALRPKSVDAYMTSILEIIIGGNHSNWMREPFRSAFLKQLESYVDLAKDRTDRASYEDASGREMIIKMVQVLAIQQLMTLPADRKDLSLNRASLFRYLSYILPGITNRLAERAFRAVSENIDARCEFGWRDLDDLKGLAMKVSSHEIDGMPLQTSMMYEGNNTVLRIEGASLSVVPAIRQQHVRPVLPPGMLPWHNIQVFVNDRIDPLFPGETSYRKLSEFWQKVEHSLFHYERPRTRRRKLRPHLGDEVDIVVDSVSSDGKTFQCHISEDNLQGTGTLELREIVPYNIEKLELRHFRDKDGNPYRLRAKVMNERADDSFVFSMTSLVRNYTRETYGVGDNFICVLFKRLDKVADEVNGGFRPGWVGISSDGDSVLVLVDYGQEYDIHKNDVVYASYHYITGKGQIVLNFEQFYDQEVTHHQAFTNLLKYYSEHYQSGVESDAESQEEGDEPQAMPMDQSSVAELIRVIDRQATMEESNITIYNYLAFCHLLSRMMGNEAMARYYSRRMSFLDMLKSFLDSGTVDLDNLNIDENDFVNYPRLKKEIMQLRVLSYFDHPERNGELWTLASETPSESVRSLAKLALLSNMAIEFKLSDEVRENVNREVSALLNIPLQLPTLVSFGKEECQTLEFKSSYVCPADSLRPDPERQRDHIMQRIAGFLNSETGGKLYIGVNNYGVASGLEVDLNYFEGSRDRFDLRVRNDIHTQLGARANALVDAEWCDDRFEGNRHKDVYCLTIKPCPNGLEMNGYYWVRQGTSTHRVDRSVFLQILEDRAEAARQRAMYPADPVAGSDGESQPAAAETAGEEKEEALADATLDTGSSEAQAPQPSAPVDRSMYRTGESSFAHSFSTGHLRSNPRHDWERGVDDPIPSFYIHFLGDNLFKVSDEESYETDNSLAVREEEKEGMLVAVYRNGHAIAVPMEEFHQRERDREYCRYRDEWLSFACVASMSDKLLIVYRYGNNLYGRLESVSDLRAGSITDIPQPLTTADFDEVVGCEILNFDQSQPIRGLCRVSSSQLGRSLDMVPYTQAADIIFHKSN